ncbi:MAG: SMP-30/gluconolactonase/LRE family protein [Planctomycetota bacterium]|nr:MAG: SMP-30/gluconolactonase/LRE family protein [Planctomycetota bacterium]
MPGLPENQSRIGIGRSLVPGSAGNRRLRPIHSRREITMNFHTRSLLTGLSTLFLLTLSARPAVSDDLSEIVAGPVEKVIGDCEFTEGPAWHPGGFLLFSDIPNNRILRVDVDGGVSEWLKPSLGANGLTCDAKGNVYVCQGEGRRVVRLQTGENGEPHPIGRVLAAEFEDKPFNKPNDLALDGAGGLYFTDPNYRQEDAVQPVEGVYYVSADGDVTRVVDDLPRPNGVLVTQDGGALLVANINEREIIRYPIEEPGKLGAGEVIFTGEEEADGRGPDGMTLDAEGNIYATYKSVVVLTPEGGLKGRIEVPEKPANCTFGGDDGRTLYITARTSLYSAPMQQSAADFRESGPKTGDLLVRAQALELVIPSAWQAEAPANRLRLAQFAVPGEEEDEETAGEFVVFPPFGGSATDNIKRWIDQFDPEDRKLAMYEGQAPQGDYILVQLDGTYFKPVGPPIQRKTEPTEGMRMLAVIFSAEAGGNFFLKLTGPEATVDAAGEAFRKTFGGDSDGETEYTLPEE